MNITELNNLRYIDKEIKLLQERIEELETEAGGETGRYLVRQVDYIYRGEFCLPGYCVMSISAL